LFNIYINKAIKEWTQTARNDIQLTSEKIIQTIFYAEVIIAKSDDELQMAINELNKIIKKSDMKISLSKTKAMGFCGENIERVKLEIEEKIIEQASNFNYLGYLISNYANDISKKLQRYNKMNGIIKDHFGKHMTTETKLGIHNIPSKAVSCYGSENWITNQRDAKTLEAAQMSPEIITRPYKIGPPEKS
jgi:hypothetical protein